MKIMFVTLVFSLFVTFCFADDNWPQFRGSDGLATSSANDLPIIWGVDENVIWKTKIPGKGWSSPIIWEEKVFITSAERADEKPEIHASNNRIDPNHDYKFEVYCLNKNTGEIIWKSLAQLGKPGIITHKDNTYASETPVTDGRHVYVYFGMVGLYCYDMKGNKVWEKDLGTFPSQANWGTSSSPILYEGKLIVQFDNEKNSQIIALDKRNGEEIWRTKRDESSTWSTPFIWKNKVRTELVTGGKIKRSYDPNNGELLWQLDMGGGRDITTPVADEDKIYLCNEARSDGGGTLFAVKAGGSGDISLDSAEVKNECIAWTLPKSGIAMASPVLLDGYLYALERRMGRVSCINTQTGEFAYRKQKLEGAKAFWASPWVYNNMVFCLDDTGTTHVLKAGPEFVMIATNRLEDQFWSSTAISEGILVFRGVDYLYGISKIK